MFPYPLSCGFSSWKMKFKSVHWPSQGGVRVTMPYSTNMISVRVLLGLFLIFILSFFEQLHHALVRYEMIITISVLRELLIYHYISSACSRNDFYVLQFKTFLVSWAVPHLWFVLCKRESCGTLGVTNPNSFKCHYDETLHLFYKSHFKT